MTVFDKLTSIKPVKTRSLTFTVYLMAIHFGPEEKDNQKTLEYENTFGKKNNLIKL